MNQSERLHNQGDEQQNTTPELKLSMELRDTCEKLLQEKEQNRISTSELILQTLQPLGAIRSLAKWTKPQNLIRRTEVYLKKEGDSEPNIFISCVGVNPSKAYLDILIMPDAFTQRDSEWLWGLRWLRLERKERGVIMMRNGNGKAPGIGEFMRPARLATTEDLSYYQHQINQSSPIEHK